MLTLATTTTRAFSGNKSQARHDRFRSIIFYFLQLKRRKIMGDKGGKKDKEKSQKQTNQKQSQKDKKKVDKQPIKKS
jgi:hypothetical protein